MLRIALDTTPILPKPSGIGFYVVKLLEELTQLALNEALQIEPFYQISLKSAIRGNFSVPTPLQSYPQLKFFPLPVKLTNLFIHYPQLFLPIFERSFGFASIFHGTNYTVFPMRHSRNVMTVYDLTFIKYPHYSNSIVQAYADRVRRCLRWTDLILTISASSKQDIMEYLHFPADRIIVTPLASRYGLDYPLFTNVQGPQHWGLGGGQRPYILFVSTIEPRKNIMGLIEAFDTLKSQYQIEHDLVLIGQKGWLYEPIFERIERSPHRQHIHHLNYLPDETVVEFYRQADVFVYPSHYEGFGLPVLEAMTLGTPVVCSNNSSLPEVAGDAAIMIDANDSMQIAAGIWKIIDNRNFREQLIQRGYDRAQKFTWRSTAAKTLAAYRLLA